MGKRKLVKLAEDSGSLDIYKGVTGIMKRVDVEKVSSDLHQRIAEKVKDISGKWEVLGVFEWNTGFPEDYHLKRVLVTMPKVVGIKGVNRYLLLTYSTRLDTISKKTQGTCDLANLVKDLDRLYGEKFNKAKHHARYTKS